MYAFCRPGRRRLTNCTLKRKTHFHQRPVFGREGHPRTHFPLLKVLVGIQKFGSRDLPIIHRGLTRFCKNTRWVTGPDASDILPIGTHPDGWRMGGLGVIRWPLRWEQHVFLFTISTFQTKSVNYILYSVYIRFCPASINTPRHLASIDTPRHLANINTTRRLDRF